ncbi:MAK10-like protein [Tanacetum coccineum]
MGDENPIRTLGDYSKPSHEGYRNTIELPVGNNVVPLRSDTIQLVQNGCSFYGLRSEDPKQHLKDFLKLVDSIDLDGGSYYPIPCSILSTGKDRKTHNDILMLQQHHGESLSEAWTRFKDLLQKVPHHGIDRWLQIQIFYDHVSFHLKCEIDHATGSKLHNKNADESWEIIENLALYDHEGPAPQPQALGTTFEARVRDYMAAYTKRIERFEKTIFKQRDEINDRMTEMFWLLKELMTSRTPEKVLIREEAKFPVTKNVNSISLARNEEEENNNTDETPDNIKMPTKTEMPVRKTEAMNGAKNGAGNESIKTPKNDEAVEAFGSQPVTYYLKHKINEKLIKGLVKNNRFNNSLSRTQVGKKKRKAYKVLPGGTWSDVNIMPYSTYMRLTDERPAETDIRLSLASHSYIDVLVEVAELVFPVEFMILDIKENEKMPFILGTQFLTTANATIRFDISTITLRSGKSKVSFHRISDSSCITNKGVKNDIEPIAPIMTVNRLVLELEERIKLHLEKEMKFNQWKSNNFKNKQPAPVKVEGGMEDEGEVM